MRFLDPRKSIAVVLCACFFGTPASAQPQEAPASLLRFAPGQTEIVVRGTVSGYQGLDYVFDAFPGADASIVLEHRNQSSLYHNVIAPSGAMIFNGSMDGKRFQGVLRERGRYRVSVYHMRNDARRGKQSAFTLRIRQSDVAVRPPPPSQTSGPSFDCRRSLGPVETAICRSAFLSEQDGRLAFVYRDALAGASPRRAEEIRRDQRAWLGSRDACARERVIERCLGERYAERIRQLEAKR